MYELLETGYRMQSPEGCPPPVYELMRHCWEWEPIKRPRFDAVSTMLNSMSDINEGKCGREGGRDRSEGRERGEEGAFAV